MDVGANLTFYHGASLSNQTPKSKSGAMMQDMVAVILDLGEKGEMAEGNVLTLTNMLSGIHKNLENREDFVERKGEWVLGYSMLVFNPESAGFTSIAPLLCHREFCLIAGSAIIDAIRIYRKDPTQGPNLNAQELRILDKWASTVVDGAMARWAHHFESVDKWPPYFNEYKDGQDGTFFQVPLMFRTLVANLIFMRMDMWPMIRVWLNRFKILGPNLFASKFWEECDLHALVLSEPRIASFIVDAEHISITDFARMGPLRRSETVRKGVGLQDIQALDPQRLKLFQRGVRVIRKRHNGIYQRQMGKGGVQTAMHFKYPCENNPSIHDLLGFNDPWVI